MNRKKFTVEQNDALQDYAEEVKEILNEHPKLFIHHRDVSHYPLRDMDMGEPRIIHLEFHSPNYQEAIELITENSAIKFLKNLYPDLQSQFSITQESLMSEFFEGSSAKPWRYERTEGNVTLIAEDVPRNMPHQLNHEYEASDLVSAITVNGCALRSFYDPAISTKLMDKGWLAAAAVLADEFHKVQQDGAGFYQAITYDKGTFASVIKPENSDVFFLRVGDECFDLKKHTPNEIAYVLSHEWGHKKMGDLDPHSPQERALEKLEPYPAVFAILAALNGRGQGNQIVPREMVLEYLLNNMVLRDVDGLLKNLDECFATISEQTIAAAKSIESYNYSPRHAKADGIPTRSYTNFEDLDSAAVAAELEKDKHYAQRSSVREHSFLKKCAAMSELPSSTLEKLKSLKCIDIRAFIYCIDDHPVELSHGTADEADKALDAFLKQYPQAKDVNQKLDTFLEKHADLLDACLTLNIAQQHIYHARELRADLFAVERSKNANTGAEHWVKMHDEHSSQNQLEKTDTHPAHLRRAQYNASFAQFVENSRISSRKQERQ